mgnify:FL=1
MSYGMKKRGYSLAVPKDKKKVRAMMSEQLKKYKKKKK